MRVKPIKSFIIKELKLSFRDKENIFWIFAWPILWIILTSAIFVPPTVGKPLTLKVGVINNDYNSTAPFNGTLLVNILNNTDYQNVRIFDVREYDNLTKLIDDVKKDTLDAGIIIPSKFGERVIYGQSNLKIYIYGGDIRKGQIISSILNSYFQKFNLEISYKKTEYTMKYIKKYVSIHGEFNLSQYEEFLRGIALPMNISYEKLTPSIMNKRETILGWYTFGAIGMVMLYTGFSLGALMVLEERDKGTLRRLLSTPSTPSEMLIGKTISALIILGLASILSIAVGISVGSRIIWNPYNPFHWLVILIFILIAIFTIGFGLIISITTKSSKGASGLAVIIGLFLSFIAGIWLPEWMLPNWMHILADIFPPTWGIDIIRNILVYNAPFKEVYLPMLKLLIASVITYLIGIFIYNMLIRKYAEE